MTTVALQRPETAAPRAARRPGLWAAVRVELAKLIAQWPLRIVLGLCVLAPICFAAFTKSEWPSGPSDTLFGRWSGTTGFATSLTLLNSAAIYGVPLLTGLFAGDIFAGEDRHGTWKTILTRSNSRTHVFAGKAIASALCVYAGFIAIGIMSLLSGVAICGASSLVGMSGQLISGGQAWGLVASAWAYELLPATAFIALGLLLSIASRSSVVGVLGPLAVAGALQLLEFVDYGQIVRVVAPVTPLDAWHAMFTKPGNAETLVQGAINSLVWAAIFAVAAWWLLLRRGFASSDANSRTQLRAGVRILVLAAVILAVFGAIADAGPTNLTAKRLQASIAPTFANLSAVRYEWQTGTPGEANVPMAAQCDRGAGTEQSTGAGDDWSCVIVDARASDGAQPVTYDVTLKPDGCYTAETGMTLGALLVNNARGKPFINPVYAFDGCLGTP